jgi:hypothetical protein
MSVFAVTGAAHEGHAAGFKRRLLIAQMFGLFHSRLSRNASEKSTMNLKFNP